MIYNGVHASSFQHVKVTSWRSSLHTDFDREEIVYRGIIRAAVEVPTVRTVEADMLVRGKTTQEITKKLRDIAYWLTSAGTAKLFSARDPNNYFNARCTSISMPEYSGRSARVTITFTCSDHRLYSARTDQPLQTSASDLSNFTFDGKHCLNDMGCIFVEDSRDATPPVLASKYEISGVSGSVRYCGAGIVVDEKRMNGTLYLVNNQSADGLMTEAAITQQMHDIASWLVNAERAALVLDSDATRQYEAEVVAATTATRTNWENGALKVKFILQPISKTIESKSTSSSITLAANASGTLSLATLVEDGIGFTTPLVLTIKNTGTATITDLYLYYYDESNVQKSMRLNGAEFAISAGETLMMDSCSASIKKGQTDGIKWLKHGDFPMITPKGAKSLLLKSNVATTLNVTASCNVRWL